MEILQRPWQFRQVYRDGRRIDCRYAVVFYRRSGDPDHEPQFGFVASKRVGNAVQRNRAKRLLREAVRPLAGRFRDSDVWVVLVARPAILNTTYQDLCRTLTSNLARSGLIDSTA